MAGLASALGLALRGRAVTLVEPRTAPTPDHWGLTLWPPAVRALANLGVADRILEQGATLRSLCLLSRGGGEWINVPLSRPSASVRFIGVAPSDVEQALSDAAEAAGVRFLRGHRFLHMSHVDRGVEVLVEGGGAVRCLSTQLVVAADGPRSALRGLIGGDRLRFQPPGQSVFTGIGGPVPNAESRQMMGDGWSAGTVCLGRRRSWVFAVVEEQEPAQVLARCRVSERSIDAGMNGFQGGVRLRPFSAHVPEWAADRLVLVGEAAHPLLPHLGLGGSQTLEGVSVVVEVVDGALRRGDLSARALSAYQRQRRDRVAYARRVADVFALVCTSRIPGVRLLRDLNLLRLSLWPDAMSEFIAALAGDHVPPFRQRLAVGVP